MARTLDAGLAAAIVERGTSPGWLIEIGTTTPLRYSTRGTLSYGGYTWVGGAVLSGVEFSGDLGASVTLELPNTDNAASALALTDLLREVEVTLWAYYDVSGTGYAEELRTLAVDAVESINSTRVEFSLSSIAEGASRLPDVLVGPPLCNHIPPAGTVIRWGWTTVTLERK